MTIDQFLYAYVADENTYSEGSVIMEEGKKGSWVYVILEGQAKVMKEGPKGPVSLGLLKKGAILGEMGFFDWGQGYRTATVIANGGEVKVGVLDSDRLVIDYESLSPQLRGLIRVLMQRLKESTEKVCEVLEKEVE